MKTLTEGINEASLSQVMKSLVQSINESADKVMRGLFGQRLTLGSKAKAKLSKLGMNPFHEYDEFVIYEDGHIEYTNRFLFEAPIVGKCRKVMLNRIIKADDLKAFHLCGEPVFVPVETLDVKTPYNYLKAVLNAFAHGFIKDGVIDDLDYTSGDFEKDKASKEDIVVGDGY